MLRENTLHPLVGAVLRPLPLFPLTGALGHVANRVADRHRRLFERLGEEARKTFAIEPTDLPFALLLAPDTNVPDRPRMRLDVVRDLDGAAYDARIAGPFLTLVDMGRGRLDGDALFFSNDIQVEGDVAAVVALRNALDADGIDLIAEASETFGPAGGLALGAIDRVDALVRRFLTDRGTMPAESRGEVL